MTRAKVPTQQSLYHLELVTVRVRCSEAPSSPAIGSPTTEPDSAARIARAIFDELDLSPDVEHFGILGLDVACRVTSFKVHSTGIHCTTPVDAASVFRDAIAMSAHRLIAFHNHPSGELTPSRDDIDLTRRLCKLGGELGVPMFDHIILATPARETAEWWRSIRATMPGLFLPTFPP